MVTKSDRDELSREDLLAYAEQLEGELQSSRQLEEIGIISKIIAHDLNNFLTPILGYATIIKRETKQDDPLHKGLAVIEKAAERAAGLVGQLLGTVRQVNISKTPIDLHHMLKELLDHFSANSQATVEISTEISSSIPTTHGNVHQLERALRCLMENAYDAMPSGGKLTIKASTIVADSQFCRTHAQVAQGNYLCISVSDNGRGIPADIADRVFEPFFSTKLSQPGRGIGLTLVNSIMRLHSGAIDIESSDGNGTTVRIYLPENLS